DVENIYGRRSFLGMYLTAVILLGLGWLAFQMALHPGGDALLVGASGAVTAVMILFVCHFPTRPIYLFGILPMPAWLLGGLYVLQDLRGLAVGDASQVAYAAHVSGALYGYFFFRTQWSLGTLLPRGFSMRVPKRRPNLT